MAVDSQLLTDLNRDWTLAGVKSAVIDLAIAAGGNANAIAAVTGKAIVVLGVYLMPSSSAAFRFRSGTGTNKTGAIVVTAGLQVVMPPSRIPWLETAAGQALNVLNASGTAALGLNGVIQYLERG